MAHHALAGGWEKCGGRPKPRRIVSRWAKEPFIKNFWACGAQNYVSHNYFTLIVDCVFVITL